MEQENKQENRFEETMIEGRNAVLEAFRSGKTVDKLFVLDGCQDGPVKTICLLYTSPSPRDMRRSRMPSSA